MAVRKRRRKAPARRRTTYGARKAPVKRRRSSTRRTSGGDKASKIFVAVLVMQLLSGLLSKLKEKLNIAWLPQELIVPGMIYFLSRYKVIPVADLDTVSLTFIANTLFKKTGINYLGDPYGLNYQANVRTPGQTWAQLTANQRRPSPYSGSAGGTMQAAEMHDLKRNYQSYGAGGYSLQPERIAAALQKPYN